MARLTSEEAKKKTPQYRQDLFAWTKSILDLSFLHSFFEARRTMLYGAKVVYNTCSVVELYLGLVHICYQIERFWDFLKLTGK